MVEWEGDEENALRHKGEVYCVTFMTSYILIIPTCIGGKSHDVIKLKPVRTLSHDIANNGRLAGGMRIMRYVIKVLSV